jgi:hypothetical protein
LRCAGEQLQVQHRLRHGLHLADVPEDLAGFTVTPGAIPWAAREISP